MIRYKNQKQMSLEGFETPFQTTLDKDNRWVKMSNSILWDKLAMGYYRCLSSDKGRPAKDARLVKGLMATVSVAVILIGSRCFFIFQKLAVEK